MDNTESVTELIGALAALNELKLQIETKCKLIEAKINNLNSKKKFIYNSREPSPSPRYASP